MDWLLLLLLHSPCLDTIMYRLESVRMLQANPAYAVLFVVSMLFPALASIFKERIFAKEVGSIQIYSATRFVSHPAPITWMP